jgi:hypothetical protein
VPPEPSHRLHRHLHQLHHHLHRRCCLP